jgi:tRNA uridine 5-carboxymethylaminomethyl modification enzyme
MGVMVDDLVTRGTDEPYRMMTSRAEYRLLLREDNADLRLMEKGCELGLHGTERLEGLRVKKVSISGEIERLKQLFCRPSVCNPVLEESKSSPVTESVSLYQLLKRPELDYSHIVKIEGQDRGLPDDVRNQVEIQCKYEGYLERQESDVRKFRQLERISIPAELDYCAITGLSNEARQKLSSVRPRSLGQASRIPGITPSAISILMVFLKAAKVDFNNPTA